MLRSAVILAGGKSSRMGRNKAFLKISGKYILELIIEGLKPLVNDLFVVTKEEYKPWLMHIVPRNVKILTDTLALEGPLVGIYSAFLHIASEYAYVHPVDSPVIKRGVIEYIFDKAYGYDGAVIQWPDGTIDPLHAVYKVETGLVTATRSLKDNNTSAKSLTRGHINYIPVNHIYHFDERLLSLININREEDLEIIEKILT